MVLIELQYVVSSREETRRRVSTRQSVCDRPTDACDGFDGQSATPRSHASGDASGDGAKHGGEKNAIGSRRVLDDDDSDSDDGWEKKSSSWWRGVLFIRTSGSLLRGCARGVDGVDGASGVVRGSKKRVVLDDDDDDASDGFDVGRDVGRGGGWGVPGADRRRTARRGAGGLRVHHASRIG